MMLPSPWNSDLGGYSVPVLRNEIGPRDARVLPSSVASTLWDADRPISLAERSVAISGVFVIGVNEPGLSIIAV